MDRAEAWHPFVNDSEFLIFAYRVGIVQLSRILQSIPSRRLCPEYFVGRQP
jgi:hypothetical protein